MRRGLEAEKSIFENYVRTWGGLVSSRALSYDLPENCVTDPGPLAAMAPPQQPQRPVDAPDTSDSPATCDAPDTASAASDTAAYAASAAGHSPDAGHL